MNTNMTGFRWFQKYLRPRALGKSSLSIGRVDTRAPITRCFYCRGLSVSINILYKVMCVWSSILPFYPDMSTMIRASPSCLSLSSPDLEDAVVALGM